MLDILSLKLVLIAFDPFYTENVEVIARFSSMDANIILKTWCVNEATQSKWSTVFCNTSIESKTRNDLNELILFFNCRTMFCDLISYLSWRHKWLWANIYWGPWSYQKGPHLKSPSQSSSPHDKSASQPVDWKLELSTRQGIGQHVLTRKGDTGCHLKKRLVRWSGHVTDWACHILSLLTSMRQTRQSRLSFEIIFFSD